MQINSDFKNAVTKTGLVMAVIFTSRILADIAVKGFGQLSGSLGAEAVYYLTSLVSILIIYGGGIIGTMLVLGVKMSDIVPLYKNKTKRLGKAVSWTVPTYGAGQIINMTVLFISFLLVKNKNAVQETYSPVTSGSSGTSLINIIFLVFQLSVLAPVFEEFWFRGVVQTRLEGFGNGFAIMISALLFGLTHGNIHQFCYTFVMGIAMGYVRYATGGLVASTIIHALLNSVSSVILTIMSSKPVVSAIAKLGKGLSPNDFENGMLTLLGVVMLTVIIMMIAGMVSAINKLKNNRLYRPVNNYPEVSKQDKFKALFVNPAFIIGLVLCTGYIIVQMLVKF